MWGYMSDFIIGAITGACIAWLSMTITVIPAVRKMYYDVQKYQYHCEYLRAKYEGVDV